MVVLVIVQSHEVIQVKQISWSFLTVAVAVFSNVVDVAAKSLFMW